MKRSKTVLVWCDLETTGLNQDAGRILEYAVVCTDPELNDMLYMSQIIPQNVNIARELMDEHALNMHTENGLLEELEAVAANALQYKDSVKQAEDDILQMLDAITEIAGGNVYDIKLIMSGSNPLFDIKWIMRHMPGFADRIEHRSVIQGPESYINLDVSVYKVGFPDIFQRVSDSSHRAMDDIRASIASHAKMQAIVEDAWKYEQLDR